MIVGKHAMDEAIGKTIESVEWSPPHNGLGGYYTLSFAGGGEVSVVLMRDIANGLTSTKENVKGSAAPSSPRLPLCDAASDLELVTNALEIAVQETEALIDQTGEGFEDEEDLALWEFAKRTLAAAKAGDLSPIREELKREQEAGG